MKDIDLTALGEILIDFTSCGVSSSGQELFERNAGGAPANVAAAVARLGGKSAFIGKTGTDQFGFYLKQSLDSIGVDTRGLVKTNNDHTTLAFVSLTETGERTFSFCRNPGADTQLEASELNQDILTNTLFLHIGSLSLTHEPSKTATLTAIEQVRSSGGLISYDPNWRAPLWPSSTEGISTMQTLFPKADIVKISIEELALIFGLLKIEYSELGFYSQRILEQGPLLVLVSLGPDGVFYYFEGVAGFVKTWPIKVVDTTGAGDSFVGSFLYRISNRMKNSYEELSIPPNTNTRSVLKKLLQDSSLLEEDLLFATAAASLCVSKRGAIPALANLEEVEHFMKNAQ